MNFRSIDITAPGKLLALLLVIIICGAYVVWGEGDKTPAWSTLGIVVGYIAGNATGAVRGQPTVAPFAPKAVEGA